MALTSDLDHVQAKWTAIRSPASFSLLLPFFSVFCVDEDSSGEVHEDEGTVAVDGRELLR